MCAANNSPLAVSKPSNEKYTTKPVPKWMKMKQQNRSSADKTVKPIVQKSSSSAQKPKETRNAKRARWAKKRKPVAKPVVRRDPEKEYISACCSVPARKPKAGERVSTKDPDSGKMKEVPRGLGHWHCSQCGKIAKVTPRKTAPKEVAVDMAKVEMATIASLSEVPSAQVS